MEIEVRLEMSEAGIFLTRIARPDDADAVCEFFRQKGILASMTQNPLDGGFQVSLPGATFAQLVRWVADSNLKLV